jgi:2-polyprenyl-3-methyl-5-hydroxy-6-metoxy-1,4-benzoquinol methylase
MPASTLATETLTACPICRNRIAEPFLTAPDRYLAMNLHRCTQCGAIFLNPRLTSEAVLQVENESTVYDYSPEQIAALLDQQLPPVAAWIAQHRKSTGQRWLDIGCNRGFLLEVARRQGWQVTGIEIASEAAERARANYGLTVFAALDELPLGATFDVITAWHVLEHTFDPVAFLGQAAARLAPGGVLAIQVPSFDFVETYRERNQFEGIVCAVHNFQFTLGNLRALLERSELQILHLDNNAEYLLLTAIVGKEPSRRGVVARLRRWLKIG